jgi:hypothetical protein
LLQYPLAMPLKMLLCASQRIPFEIVVVCLRTDCPLLMLIV